MIARGLYLTKAAPWTEFDGSGGIMCQTGYAGHLEHL